jgi:hypothetical protein
MRTLILNEDLKTLVQGVAVVAVAGLLMGAVAHPNLSVGKEAEGPQMLMAGGGPRGVQLISDPGVGAYAGRVPEYVIGTDWTRPKAEPAWWASEPERQPQEDTGPAVVFTSDDNPAQAQVTRTAWRDEPREPPSYPSARGGVAYEANLPAPPSPPGDDDAADEVADNGG